MAKMERNGLFFLVFSLFVWTAASAEMLSDYGEGSTIARPSREDASEDLIRSISDAVAAVSLRQMNQREILTNLSIILHSVVNSLSRPENSTLIANERQCDRQLCERFCLEREATRCEETAISVEPMPMFSFSESDCLYGVVNPRTWSRNYRHRVRTAGKSLILYRYTNRICGMFVSTGSLTCNVNMLRNRGGVFACRNE